MRPLLSRRKSPSQSRTSSQGAWSLSEQHLSPRATAFQILVLVKNIQHVHYKRSKISKAMGGHRMLH